MVLKNPCSALHALGWSALVWLLLCCAWVAQAQTLVDPTRPPGWKSDAVAEAPGRTPPPRFEVSLVKLSSSQRLAVINGRSVREGDEVDGARVVAIRRETVELEHQGRRLLAVTPGSARAGFTRPTAATVSNGW